MDLTLSVISGCLLGICAPYNPSLVGTEYSDRVSESVSEVGSSVRFLLVGPGSRVGSAEEGLFGDFLSSDSSEYIIGGIIISL